MLLPGFEGHLDKGGEEMNKRSTLRMFRSREITVIIILSVLVIIFGTSTKNFLSPSNIRNLFLQVSTIGIASIGMTMVIITAGIDVSAGSILGIIAVVAGKTALLGYPVWLILLLTILVGGVLGSLNGSIIAFIGIPPILVTLGTMSFLRAMVFQLLRGRWIGSYPPFPDAFRKIGTGVLYGVPIPVWIMLFLIIIFLYYLRYRPTGRYIYAVGNNMEAARVSGIPVKKVLFLVYLLAGMLYGIAGYIVASRTGIVQTNTGSGFELSVIAATVLGGTNILGGEGTVLGSVLGALLVAVIKNGMILMNLPALAEGLIVGSIIIGSVLADILKSGRREK